MPSPVPSRRRAAAKKVEVKPLRRGGKIKLVVFVVLLLLADVGLTYYYFFVRGGQNSAGAVEARPLARIVARNTPPAAPLARVVGPSEVKVSAPQNNTVKNIETKVTLPGVPLPPLPPQVVPQPKPRMASNRYRQPSSDPRFGQGFNYAKAVSGNLAAVPLTKRARSGILVDLNTHRVLWEKDAYRSVPIASMTKMMTVLLLFERLEADMNFSLATPLAVSRKASMVGESSVYLKENEVFTVEEYLKAVIIKSANDAAYVLGEYLGGGEIDKFLEMMNKRAEELHMPGAVYRTPNGLPNAKREESYGSAEGMALLGERLLEFPAYLDYSSSKGGKIRQMVYANTNKLLSKVEGVDGLKTGFTIKAGSCITVSCLRNNRRLLLVLTGFPSSADRNNCATQLLEWGYKH